MGTFHAVFFIIDLIIIIIIVLYCRTYFAQRNVTKKVSYAKNLFNLKKQKSSVNEYYFKLTLEKLVAANVFVLRNGDSDTFSNWCGGTVQPYNNNSLVEKRNFRTKNYCYQPLNMEDFLSLGCTLEEYISDNNIKNDNFGSKDIIE